MKTQTLIILLLSSLLFSCKNKNLCDPEFHEFNISPETKEWLPDEIIKDDISFQNNNGEILVFTKEYTSHNEHNKIFSNPCGKDDSKSETINYERIFTKYISSNGLNFSMATNISNTVCGWGNVKEVKLVENVQASISRWAPDTTSIISIGHLTIITKFINACSTENFCSIFPAKHNDQIEINGTTYNNVYTDDRPGHENSDYPLAEIYFQKGKGIIGFVDEVGIVWEKID